MLIAPLALPNSVRTLVWFNEIAVVEAMPSSVLTWDIEIAPDAGNAISDPL
jgi:hypothetical protein